MPNPGSPPANPAPPPNGTVPAGQAISPPDWTPGGAGRNDVWTRTKPAGAAVAAAGAAAIAAMARAVAVRDRIATTLRPRRRRAIRGHHMPGRGQVVEEGANGRLDVGVQVVIDRRLV